MSRFYRKPKPGTMRKNREVYHDIFREEMSWLKENIQTLQKNKHKFLVDMYTILITGNRKVTPKMASTIKNSIEKCKNNPLYNEELREEANKKIQPILSKINMVMAMAESKNDKGVDFVKSVENYVKTNYRITKKQMESLNKVYKRVTEDLFDKGNDNETK